MQSSGLGLFVVVALVLGCAGAGAPPTERDRMIEELLAIHKEVVVILVEVKDQSSLEKATREIEERTRRVEELTRRKKQLAPDRRDSDKETRQYHEMGAAWQEVQKAWTGLQERMKRREVRVEGPAEGRFHGAMHRLQREVGEFRQWR